MRYWLGEMPVATARFLCRGLSPERERSEPAASREAGPRRARWLRGGVDSRHRDPDAIPQGTENTDQEVAGDVLDSVVQDGGYSGPGRSCPLCDRGVSELSLPNDLFQMLQERMADLPFPGVGRLKVKNFSQWLGSSCNRGFDSKHREAPSNVFLRV